jgi:tetratricopeptide (TPR) repeat protein
MGALALFPLLGMDDTAEEAVRRGNAHYAAGEYEAASAAYEEAAGLKPEAAEIAFDQGNAWFRRHEPDRAIEHWMAALGSKDPAILARVKYNIGVARLREAVAAERSPARAVPEAEAAARYFRESLAADANLEDARYNLEVTYRLLHGLRRQMLDRSSEDPQLQDSTTLGRGAALQDLIRAGDQDKQRALPDQLQQTTPEPTDEAPDRYAPKSEQRERNEAALPVAVNLQAAADLLERLLKEMEAAEVWRHEKRQAALQAPGEREPW